MREIKFRGLSSAGNWVYGYYFSATNGASGCTIVSLKDGKNYTVSSKTVGQFTGLHDGEGKDIYENDIVTNQFLLALKCPHCGKPINENRPMVIEWDNIGGRWNKPYIDFGQSYKVLGNIHENPELLKEANGRTKEQDKIV